MKKIILAGIIFMMFMGIASASSINGEYKGNPIVKIYAGSLNTELKTDGVPAMIYNNSTVVPIALLKKMGLSVNWVQDSYSVYIELPEASSSSNNDVVMIKLYGEIAEEYRKIMVLGDSISGLNTTFYLTYSQIYSKNNPDSAITNANTNLNNVINAYNDFLTPNIYLIAKAKSLGVDIADSKTILNDLFASIEIYRKAYLALESYRNVQNNSNFNDYANNNQAGFDSSKQPRTNALSKYFEFYNKEQSF